jgi:hypothetical protein
MELVMSCLGADSDIKVPVGSLMMRLCPSGKTLSAQVPLAFQYFKTSGTRIFRVGGLSDVVLHSMATDDVHLYVHTRQGMHKIGTGAASASHGVVVATREGYRKSERTTMAVVGDHVYVSSSEVDGGVAMLTKAYLAEAGVLRWDGSGSIASADNTEAMRAGTAALLDACQSMAVSAAGVWGADADALREALSDASTMVANGAGVGEDGVKGAEGADGDGADAAVGAADALSSSSPLARMITQFPGGARMCGMLYTAYASQQGSRFGHGVDQLMELLDMAAGTDDSYAELFESVMESGHDPETVAATMLQIGAAQASGPVPPLVH